MEDSMRKHVLAISVFQWVLTFLLMAIDESGQPLHLVDTWAFAAQQITYLTPMGTFFTLLFLYLLFTSFWIIPVVYFTWLLIDWDTPVRGGRRVQWVRKWTVWKHFRDYFPIKLIKTAPLSPDRNYVLGCHPHGIIPASSFCNFATEATDFSEVYPGVRPWLGVLAGVFKLPIYRDYIMSAGTVPVSKDSLQYLLTRCGTGNAVFIIVGGAAESLQSSPGENIVTLSNRKGFVRLALENGADLVPVYCFGENDIYEQVRFAPDSWGWKIQLLFQKHVGFAPCILKGTGVFGESNWGLNPFPLPLTSVVGRPIKVPHSPVPSEDEVAHYHTLYIEGLKSLFDEYKVSCGLSATDSLKII